MKEPFTIWGERPIPHQGGAAPRPEMASGTPSTQGRTIPQVDTAEPPTPWQREPPAGEPVISGRGTSYFGGGVPESGRGLRWEERASHLCAPHVPPAKGGVYRNFLRRVPRLPRGAKVSPLWSPWRGCSIPEQQHLRPKWGW